MGRGEGKRADIRLGKRVARQVRIVPEVQGTRQRVPPDKQLWTNRTNMAIKKPLNINFKGFLTFSWISLN